MDIFYYGIVLVLGVLGLWLSSSVLIHLLETLSVRYKWSMLGLASIVLASLTSLPELLFSIVAVVDGKVEIAMGNLMGSYAANICLVVGICACIKPVKLESLVFNFKFPMLFVAILFGLLGKWLPGYALCIVMLSVYFGYMLMTIYLGEAQEALQDEYSELSTISPWVLFPIAVGFLFLSTKGILYGAVSIAGLLGISEYWIGLTVVAVGTSLPELVTSLLAQRKGMDEVIVAQAVGSNVFMFLFIIPIIGLINMDVFNIVEYYEFICLFVIVLVVLLFARFFDLRWQINRLEGVCLIVLYWVYLLFH